MLNTILSFIGAKPLISSLVAFATLVVGGFVAYKVGHFVGGSNLERAIDKAVYDAVKGEREKSNLVIKQQNDTITGMVANLEDWHKTYEQQRIDSLKVSNLIAENNRELDRLTEALKNEDTIIVGTCDATINADSRDRLRNEIIANANTRPD